MKQKELNTIKLDTARLSLGVGLHRESQVIRGRSTTFSRSATYLVRYLNIDISRLTILACLVTLGPMNLILFYLWAAVRRCFLNWPFWTKEHPQMMQVCCFLLVWVARWSFRLETFLKFLLQFA